MQKPSAKETELIKQVIKYSNDAILDWINLGTADAMNNWNSHRNPST
ncbi:hypothetical protein GF391_02775 [Candidatus Uhrbacteria bacterium]|nr:hypothetical protein [Candidatus Uhrbacteria bacterium]